MFSDGPDVSLNGSPTVSPTTAALWASEPFPFSPSRVSMYFFALSQAPPAFDINIAINTPVTRAPAHSPPRVSGPNAFPINNGTTIASAPGITISFRDALVEMSTHDA